MVEAEKVVVREGRDWMEVRRIDPRRRLWVVTGGTVGVAGDVVRLPSLPRISPFDAHIVVDSVTGAVLLPESGEPRSRLGKAMQLVRLLEAAGLPRQAQIVRDWLRDTWDDDLRERHAA